MAREASGQPLLAVRCMTTSSGGAGVSGSGTRDAMALVAVLASAGALGFLIRGKQKAASAKVRCQLHLAAPTQRPSAGRPTTHGRNIPVR